MPALLSSAFLVHRRVVIPAGPIPALKFRVTIEQRASKWADVRATLEKRDTD
jgi:hypothetical protein